MTIKLHKVARESPPPECHGRSHRDVCMVGLAEFCAALSDAVCWGVRFSIAPRVSGRRERVACVMHRLPKREHSFASCYFRQPQPCHQNVFIPSPLVLMTTIGLLIAMYEDDGFWRCLGRV